MRSERHLFLDTSALVKHYHDEQGSDTVNRLWQDAGKRLCVSRLAVLEITAALAAKVRARQLAIGDFHAFRYRFFDDLARERPRCLPLTNAHFQHAERLLRDHAPGEPLRTLDALQLAVALGLRDDELLERFVAADRQLLRLTRLNDLPVLKVGGS